MTERPLDCDPEQGGRQGRALLEWMEADAKITHVEGGEMGNMEREKALLDLRWDGLSFCVTRSRWHSSPACSSSFLRQIGSFSCVSHCFTLRLRFPPSPLGDALFFSPSLPFSSVSKWKANSVALSEAGSSAGHFSPDRVPRRGRRR